MGRAWLRTVGASPDAQIVGLVDLDLTTARTAAAEAGLDVPLGTSLAELLPSVGAEAVLNVTIPVAHLPVSAEALAAGLPVLCEKPAAPSVAAAQQMARAAREAGRLLMISQSRRYYPHLETFRRQVGTLGGIGTLVCEFFKEAHFPGFREEMAHPLLVDMAIHHVDQARFLTGADPVRVAATTHNPPWSWFAGDASATVDVAYDDGSHLGYVGSWVTRGAETSWNGSWRVAGELGSARWDGEHAPTYDGPGPVDPAPDAPTEIAGSLAEFVSCVRTGASPDTRIDRNLLSLATVEAAVLSADEHRVVEIAEVLAPSNTP
jgi:predicted dehydrogenase